MSGRLLLKRKDCHQLASRFSDGARYGYLVLKRLQLNYQTLKANTLVLDDNLGWSKGMNVESSTNSTGYYYNSQKKGYDYASVMAALLNDQDLNCHINVPEKSVVLDNGLILMAFFNIRSIVIRRGKSHDNAGDERIGFCFDSLKNRYCIVLGLCLMYMVFNNPKANE
jgi:hypothetical protein